MPLVIDSTSVRHTVNGRYFTRSSIYHAMRKVNLGVQLISTTCQTTYWTPVQQPAREWTGWSAMQVNVQCLH